MSAFYAIYLSTLVPPFDCVSLSVIIIAWRVDVHNLLPWSIGRVLWRDVLGSSQLLLRDCVGLARFGDGTIIL